MLNLQLSWTDHAAFQLTFDDLRWTFLVFLDLASLDPYGPIVFFFDLVFWDTTSTSRRFDFASFTILGMGFLHLSQCLLTVFMEYNTLFNEGLVTYFLQFCSDSCFGNLYFGFLILFHFYTKDKLTERAGS